VFEGHRLPGIMMLEQVHMVRKALSILSAGSNPGSTLRLKIT
jgi:hypothetical protein